MGNTLQDKTVVVVGRGSGIARAIALLSQSEGALGRPAEASEIANAVRVQSFIPTG